MGGALGAIIAAVVGSVVAVVAAVGVVTAVNSTPAPIDKPLVTYGNTSS
ncbi:MAG: hypothetical protein WCI74_00325 [Actinomycetes bacterium]